MTNIIVHRRITERFVVSDLTADMGPSLPDKQRYRISVRVTTEFDGGYLHADVRWTKPEVNWSSYGGVELNFARSFRDLMVKVVEEMESISMEIAKEEQGLVPFADFVWSSEHSPGGWTVAGLDCPRAEPKTKQHESPFVQFDPAWGGLANDVAWDEGFYTPERESEYRTLVNLYQGDDDGLKLAIARLMGAVYRKRYENLVRNEVRWAVKPNKS